VDLESTEWEMARVDLERTEQAYTVQTRQGMSALMEKQKQSGFRVERVGKGRTGHKE
jgi:hypothetical protein